MSNTSTSNDKTAVDDAKVKLIIGEIGRDTKTGIIGRGYSFDNGRTFHVTDTIYGRLYDDRDVDGVWNNGMHEKVKEKVNQEITNTVEPAIKQAIVEINSAVSDAVSDAAVARSDGLRAWDAAQSNADLIDLNYASASAAISSARTEAIAAADEAKASASAAQADIVAARSDVAAVQADVTAARSDVAIAKSDIADTKTNLTSQAKSLSSYAAQASAAGKDITTLKSQAGQLEQDMASTKGDVSQLKLSASSASVALSDAAGNISSLQATAKSYSAALSDTNSNVASVTATASELETKYADAAGDINKLQTDAKGTAQTLADAQGDIAKLKIRADGFDTEFASTNGDISKLQTDASGTKQTLTNAKSDIAVLQSRADGFDTKYANVAGDVNTLKVDAKGFNQTLVSAKGDISTLQATATGFKNTLTDAQGNISTLQSDVSGLKKTTSDHAGNIATLQSDAKTLTSQMSSAQGDISTLKQTASGFSSKVSGMETSLANTMQNRGTVNAPDFNSLTQAGYYTITSPIGGKNYPTDSWGTLEVSGQVTDINGRLNQKYVSDNNGTTYTRQYNANTKGWTAWVKVANQNDVDTLNGEITTNSTAIEQNKKAITLKADQTTVDKTNGTVQQLQAQLKVQEGQINAKVSSSDLPKLVGGGGRNLLRNSNVELHGKAYSLGGTPLTIDHLEAGETYTMSWYGKVDANATKHKQPLQVYIYNASWGWATVGTIPYTANEYQRNAFTFTVPNNVTDVDRVEFYLKHYNDDSSQSQHDKDNDAGIGYVKNYMLEKGAIAHDWQPAPEDTQTYTQTQIKQTADSWNANLTSVKNGLTDKYTNLHATVDGIQAQVFDKNGSSRITQLSNLIATKVSSSDFDNLSKSVNLQTLDSADINSMRTNGHYFVHNLANNPISGWVYVDVTGNGNDRIRQDVYQDTGNQHCYRRWYGNYWTAWSQGATESEIIQLSDDINIRVKKGDVVSQINQEAGGNTLIQVSNGKGKLALNASSVIFSGSAFIPDAYISTLNADKLRFYDDSGNVATMSAGLKQYDDDKTKRSIVLQYSGGYEVHASNLLGSILTMHDDSIRLAVKAHGADTGQSDQYSGFYASSHYAQVSCYRSDGKAPGIYITDDGFTIKGDDSGNGTKYGDLYIVSPQIHVRGSNAVQMQAGNVHAWLSNDGILNLYKDNDGGSATATKLQVNGWAWVRGWVEAAGHSQHSALSTKTDIQSVVTTRC